MLYIRVCVCVCVCVLCLLLTFISPSTTHCVPFVQIVLIFHWRLSNAARIYGRAATACRHTQTTYTFTCVTLSHTRTNMVFDWLSFCVNIRESRQCMWSLLLLFLVVCVIYIYFFSLDYYIVLLLLLLLCASARIVILMMLLLYRKFESSTPTNYKRVKKKRTA